jgi:tetratricopeptide (TPR) repeat protein
MIEWYLTPPGQVPEGLGLLELSSRGARLLQRGDAVGAIRDGFAAIRQVQAREQDYQRAVGLLRSAFLALRRPREALALDWYSGDCSAGLALELGVPPADHARTLLSEAERTGDRALALAAGRLLEQAGRLVRAAIAYEKAREFPKARALWARLSSLIPRGDRPEDLYAAGLAEFNVLRVSRLLGDEPRARLAVSASCHLLEEAADRFESTGNRESAFYCYKVIGALGAETQIFEHVLAGAVNVLRILSEDHLRQYALSTYEETIELADRRGETLAAATLCHEMAAYARKQGETTLAERAMVKEAELFQRAAETFVRRKAPVAMAENALLSAILVLAELGQYSRVLGAYERLAALPLEEPRRLHYQRAARRYVGARDERLSPVTNEGPRETSAFPDVWHVDLLEWEGRGSAAEATADVLLERHGAPPSGAQGAERERGRAAGTYRFGEITRRRALVARLVALSFEEPSAAASADGDAAESLPDGRGALVLLEMLAPLELYGMLSCLETLALAREAEVRAAALRTLGRFTFKRSLKALRLGTEDPAPTVAREAIRAIENVRVAVAFDPLARLYRDSPVPEARRAALRALGRIELLEAAELVLEVLAYGSSADKQVVKETLKQGRARVFTEAARSTLADPTAPGHADVREIVDARR